jgi:tRNA (Thr-GGU) A37 N-methylase
MSLIRSFSRQFGRFWSKSDGGAPGRPTEVTEALSPTADPGTISLRPIGEVTASSGGRGQLTLHVEHAEATLGLDGYSHVMVLGWLHRYPAELRARVRAYPAGDRSLPLQGALALRGARPNPISLTVCRLVHCEGERVEVEGLDLEPGTPVIDLKPYVAFYDAVPESTIPAWAEG